MGVRVWTMGPERWTPRPGNLDVQRFYLDKMAGCNGHVETIAECYADYVAWSSNPVDEQEFVRTIHESIGHKITTVEGQRCFKRMILQKRL